MQAGYFQTAWNDIKHSNDWVKKIALLALLQFVPIFGQIVLFGYLYGWARDIAWNIHQPMPEHIMGNEDGKLYSRGFFMLLISFVFALIPGLISLLTNFSFGDGPNISAGAHAFAMSGSLVALVLSLFCSVFAWVGQMRAAIYGRLGPGFQLSQIWKMLRYDTNGILRILGMNLLIGLILGVIFSIVATLLGFGALASLNASGAFMGTANIDDFAALIPAMGAGSLLLLVVVYALLFGSTWLEALVARALGYWTRQFNVPAWGGQDDPLPFETSQAARQAQQAQYAAQVEYAQAQAHTAQVQGQKIAYQNQQAQQQYAQAQAQQAQAQQPDWIAQANATAPAEQRSPYTAPATPAASPEHRVVGPFENPDGTDL